MLKILSAYTPLQHIYRTIHPFVILLYWSLPHPLLFGYVDHIGTNCRVADPYLVGSLRAGSEIIKLLNQDRKKIEYGYGIGKKNIIWIHIQKNLDSV